MPPKNQEKNSGKNERKKRGRNFEDDDPEGDYINGSKKAKKSAQTPKTSGGKQISVVQAVLGSGTDRQASVQAEPATEAEPAAEAETAANPKPVAKATAVAKSKPAAKATAVAKSKPAAEAETAANPKPVAKATAVALSTEFVHASDDEDEENDKDKGKGRDKGKTMHTEKENIPQTRERRSRKNASDEATFPSAKDEQLRIAVARAPNSVPIDRKTRTAKVLAAPITPKHHSVKASASHAKSLPSRDSKAAATKKENDSEDEDDDIFFGGATDKKYGYLSNFSPHGFHRNGTYFETVEKYFQFRKALFVKDLNSVKKILLSKLPKVAKNLGRKVVAPHKEFPTNEWAVQSVKVMKHALRLKFTNRKNKNREQTLKIKAMLLNTGKRPIFEARKDSRWGIGYTVEQAKKMKTEKERTTWGMNFLGQSLMTVRKELRKETLKIAPEEGCPDDADYTHVDIEEHADDEIEGDEMVIVDSDDDQGEGDKSFDNNDTNKDKIVEDGGGGQEGRGSSNANGGDIVGNSHN